MSIKGLAQRITKAIGKFFGFPRLSKKELSILSESKLRHPGKPICHLHFGKNDLRRTLYTFFKFFDLAEINLEVSYNKMLFAEMKSDTYGRMVIEDELFRLGSRGKETKILNYNKQCDGIGTQVSDDYFHKNIEAYYFPITMHPLMYQKGIWNTRVQISSQKRSRSAFFAGAFRYATYTRLKSFDLFQVNNRLELSEYAKNNFKVSFISSLPEIEYKRDSDIVIANTSQFYIPMERLRATLSNYWFFMSMPGASVPLCHNLAESLSVGCIPIIQKGYSDLVYPNLSHMKNALIYEELDELHTTFKLIKKMSVEKIIEMSEAVLTYYNNHLTPSAVVNEIMSSSTSDVRVLSFSSSIKYLK